MSAIITNQFRKNSRELFINDIGDSTTDDYFIGIGKTEPWPTINGVDEDNINYTVPLPTNTLIEKEDTLKNLIALLKVAETFSVVPRNEWRSGRIYKVYDPYDPNIFNFETIGSVAYYPCYMTHNNKIFVCLSNNDNQASTTNVTATTYSSPSILSDSYVWAYVCDLSTTSNFYTDQFVDIPADLTVSSAISNAFNATGGVVYSFQVIDGGSNIDGSEDILLVGKDSSGAVIADHTIRTSSTDQAGFSVTISNNSITKIEITGGTGFRSGYADASVIVAGKETNIRPLVAPIAGFGFSPRSDLPSFYAGLFGQFSGNLSGEAPVNVGFRQVSLVKGPTRTDNDTPADASLNVFDTLQYLEFSGGVSGVPLDAGTVIEHQTSGAKAFLDYVDTSTNPNRVYYHQNSSEEVNEKPFETGNVDFTLPGATSSTTSKTVTGLGQGEYNPGTGEALFLENRKAILRNSNQQEDIKLVIQF